MFYILCVAKRTKVHHRHHHKHHHHRKPRFGAVYNDTLYEDSGTTADSDSGELSCKMLGSHVGPTRNHYAQDIVQTLRKGSVQQIASCQLHSKYKYKVLE